MYIYTNEDEDEGCAVSNNVTLSFEMLAKIYKEKVNASGPGKCNGVIINLKVDETPSIICVRILITFYMKLEDLGSFANEQLKLMQELGRELGKQIKTEVYIEITDRIIPNIKLA